MRAHATSASSTGSRTASDPASAAHAPLAAPVRRGLESKSFSLDPGQALQHASSLAGIATSPQLPGGDVTRPGDAAERQAQASTSTQAPTGNGAAQPDFSRVRLHTDAEAAAAASQLGARAFAYGDHIVFGERQFAPDTERGQHLLGHELAHIAQQQAGGRPFLARDPLESYRTDPIEFTRADIAANSGASYWEQKVQGSYALVSVNNALGGPAEERDAVLSVLWNNQPKLPLTAPVQKHVSIPARSGVKDSKPVLFRFDYALAAKAGDKPSVKILKLAEDGAATVSAAEAPPPAYAKPGRSAGSADFPSGASDYWKAYPDEHAQIEYWVDRAPKKFNTIVTVRSEVRGKPHQSAIRVEGEKNEQGKVTSLEYTLITESALAAENPPAGYKDKEFVDLQLDKDRGVANNALGAIHGLEKIPAEERYSVKYAIHQYFVKSTVSAEVDIVLPIAGSTKNVLYTLRFRAPKNDVEIERVGEQGATGDYIRDANALNVGRANGFAAASGNESTLKTWLNKRYPSIKVSANNVAGMLVEANKTIQADAGKPAWYATNYDIGVLDATAGEARLLAAHASQVSAAQTVDMKTFDPAEMQRIEYSMAPMSDSLLTQMRGIKMIRQEAAIKITTRGKTRIATPDTATAGLTWQNGSERTIGIFDRAFTNDSLLFAGGSQGVRPASTMTYTHELGHALGTQNGIEAAFNKFVADKKIKPTTWYAKSKPATESFPEAFAIYQSDPEWMRTNLPDLSAWFDTLSKTGKPP